MRITFLLPSYPWKPVGGVRVVYEYANRLVARGHRVCVVHARQLPNWDSHPARTLYHAARQRAKRLRNVLVHPRVRWQQVDPRVQMRFVSVPSAAHVPDGDAVLATFWATAEYVATFPASKGRPFYLVQDFYPYLGPRDRIEATWRLPLAKIAVSGWLLSLIAESGADRAVRIPNGIDQARFRCDSPILNRPAQVAMLYAIGPYKTPEVGIEAMCRVKDQFPQTRFVCFGPSRRPRTLPAWVDYHRNLSERRLVELYNASAIFLSSSVAEGFCLPAAEAMACGCAVVATDSGGIREFAEPHRTALLSPANDAAALASNLGSVLRDENLRVRLARAGRARIQSFTWEQSTDTLEQFLSS